MGDRLWLGESDLGREDWPRVCVFTGEEAGTEVCEFTFRSVPWYVYVFTPIPLLFALAYPLLSGMHRVLLPALPRRWRRLQRARRVRSIALPLVVGVLPAIPCVVLLLQRADPTAVVLLWFVALIPAALAYAVLSTVLHYATGNLQILSHREGKFLLHVPSARAAAALRQFLEQDSGSNRPRSEPAQPSVF